MSFFWRALPFFSQPNLKDTLEDERDHRRNYEAFPLLHLPDNVVIHILSFLPADVLLRQCRLVCQTFRNLIDGHALWKIKSTREHKTIPNYRFDVPPPRYYQLICRFNPFGVNLLKNASGQSGNKQRQLAYWKVLYDGGDGWGVECPPSGADPTPLEDQHCFATSYGLCSKEQIIDLVRAGVPPEVMDLIRPPIQVSEWYAARFDCGSTYRMDAVLLNTKKESVASFSTRTMTTEQWKGHEWKQVQHVFCNYGAGVRFVRFYHSGKDTQFWAGRYGAKMTGGCVRLLNLPEGTK